MTQMKKPSQALGPRRWPRTGRSERRMPVRLRWAIARDAAAITRLVNRAFLVEAFFVDGDRTSAAEVRRMMKRGGFVLAEDAGRLVASVYTEVRGERGYFGLLAVDPSRQGEGLGGLLVAAAE